MGEIPEFKCYRKEPVRKKLMITKESGRGSLEGSLRRSGIGKHRKCPWDRGFGVGS